MKFTEKLIKSSTFLKAMLSISTLMAIGTFVWLGIYEFNSLREMRHIVSSDFKALELQLETLSDASNKNMTLHQEVQSHLSKKIQTSYISFAAIGSAIVLLGCVWLLAFVYFRRQNSFSANKERLEELLYYNQVSAMHATTDQKDSLPSAFKEMQTDRDTFSAELAQALSKNHFILHYQPIVNASNGHIQDVEALIRWQHPTYGMLYPDTFLPLCENNGFIIPLGAWVFQTACQQIKKWHDMGFSRLCISINLSATQLNHPELLALITDTIKKHQIPPDCIKLEITENAVMQDVEANLKLLKSLRNLNLQLSLDDFGTGYSSLKYLKQFPISNLKIDRSFIEDMTANITSLAIVESVVSLGKSLGLTITAEGVENKNQQHMLKKLKCDFMQGYLYSKPVSVEDFTKLLLASENNRINQTNDVLYDANRYRYDLLKMEHFEQAVNVITDAFCEHEPMTKYLGIKNSDFIAFAKPMVEKAIKDGLSIVALDNNKVSACTIVEDIADPLNIPNEIDPKFKIIFSLLENLGSNFFNDRQLCKGKVAHLFITAVDKNYHGQGLSRKVNFESVRLASEKGFDFMCCEFTHDYNEQGTVKNLKNNRLLIRSCMYKDFIYEGKKPFENLDGSATAYIWELHEGAQLQYQINVAD